MLPGSDSSLIEWRLSTVNIGSIGRKKFHLQQPWAWTEVGFLYHAFGGDALDITSISFKWQTTHGLKELVARST